MTALERMAGMAPANENMRDLPQKLQMLRNNFGDGIMAAMRSSLIVATHSPYSTEDLHIEYTRALMNAMLANIASLPEPKGIKLLEELSILTDHTIKSKL